MASCTAERAAFISKQLWTTIGPRSSLGLPSPSSSSPSLFSSSSHPHRRNRGGGDAHRSGHRARGHKAPRVRLGEHPKGLEHF